MVSYLTISYLAAAVTALVVPEDINKRDSDFIKLDFSVQKNSSSSKVRSFQKVEGDGTITETLYNKDAFYLTYLYVGSNKQKIGVDIDTGSSDLWFVDANSGCQLDSCVFGTYNPGESSSSANTHQKFNISYGDNTTATGFYYTDDIGFASSDSKVVAKGAEFADATNNTSGFGVFGVGFDTWLAEATVGRYSYANVPYVLKQQGLIPKVAYSLYLDSADAQSGSIIFGGQDTAKYDGDLVTLPITTQNALTVNLGSIKLGDDEVEFDTDFLLDSGTTLLYLPSKQYDQLLGSIPNAHPRDGYYVTNCKTPVPDLTFEFNFNGITIPVPLKDTYTDDLTNADGNHVGCGYQIERGITILGDTFLRRAYVVYNLEDKVISIAKPNYSSASNIVAI